jgi:membrane-bound serine protease (ClpP class)
MFLLLAIVLLIFVPWPWSLLAALLSCFAFVGEVAFWQRRIRGRKVQTGVENLVGSVGEVIEPLRPVGQIRVLGELWQARASTEVPRGAPVRVVKVDGLTLDVEQVDNRSDP